MKCDKRLKASTLPEVLVLLVIGGILLLGVTDGLNLFSRLGNALSGRISAGSEFQTNYEHLSLLTASADSLLSRRGVLEVYRTGLPTATLRREDSLLLLHLESFTDTLFRSLTAWDTLRAEPSGEGIDTLLVNLATPDDSVITLRFSRRRSSPEPLLQLLEAETDYRYDR